MIARLAHHLAVQTISWRLGDYNFFRLFPNQQWMVPVGFESMSGNAPIPAGRKEASLLAGYRHVAHLRSDTDGLPHS